MTGSFGSWASGIWPGGGDSASAVTAAEARLGVVLPELLRDYYLSVPLRRGTLLHVRTLGDLVCVDGVLVFGDSAQQTLKYGVDLARPDGVLVGEPGAWSANEDDTLEAHLRTQVLLNRVHAEPCATVDADITPPPGWRVWVLPGIELWSDGASVMYPQEALLGAPDLAALRAAARLLAVDPEDLEEEPLSIPPAATDPTDGLRRAAQARLRGDFELAERITLGLTDRHETDACVLVALALAAAGRREWTDVQQTAEMALCAVGDRRPAEALRAWLAGAPAPTEGVDPELWPELREVLPARAAPGAVGLPPLPTDLDDPPERGDLLARLRICAAYRLGGRLDAAEKVVLHLLSHHGDDPRPWVALGLIELARGARLGAIDACTAALARVGNRRAAAGLRALLAGEPPPPGLDGALWPELAAPRFASAL